MSYTIPPKVLACLSIYQKNSIQLHNKVFNKLINTIIFFKLLDKNTILVSIGIVCVLCITEDNNLISVL